MTPKIYDRAKIVYEENVQWGEHIVIDDFVFIVAKAETVLGDHVHIASFSSVTGGGVCHIGSYTAISSGVRIFTGTEDLRGDSLFGAEIPDEYRRPVRSFVVIGKHCLIGANSVILPGVTIPEGVVIGALSLVRMGSPLSPWGVYGGNPLRYLRDRPKGRILEMAAENG